MRRSSPSNTGCVIAFIAPGPIIPPQWGQSMPYRTRLEELFVGQHVVEHGKPRQDGWVEFIGPSFAIIQMRPRNRFDASRRRAFAARDLIILS
jgi:hypothetical protein